MEKIKLKETPYGVREHADDVSRIIRVARDNHKDISENDAALVWSAHSEDFAAGWLIIESDDEILDAILKYT